MNPVSVPPRLTHFNGVAGSTVGSYLIAKSYITINVIFLKVKVLQVLFFSFTRVIRKIIVTVYGNVLGHRFCEVRADGLANGTSEEGLGVKVVSPGNERCNFVAESFVSVGRNFDLRITI